MPSNPVVSGDPSAIRPADIRPADIQSPRTAPRLSMLLIALLPIGLLQTACATSDGGSSSETTAPSASSSASSSESSSSDASSDTPANRPANDPPASPVSLPLQSGIVEGGYTMALKAGTPAQSFDVMVDTGSANLILLGDASLCDNCANIPHQTTYDPSKSSSSKLSRTSFSITYGSGKLEAREVSDTIALEGFEPFDYEFGVMTHQAHISNILGLAYEAVAQPEHHPLEPFFDVLVSKAGLANSFSILLCEKEGSEIRFGDTGTAVEHWVKTTDRKWYVISPGELRIAGGKSLGSIRVPTVVDSGTTNLMLPSAMRTAILDQLEPTAKTLGFDLSSEFIVAKADQVEKLPNIEVVIDDTSGQQVVLEIAPTTYLQAAGPDGFLLRIGVDEEQILLGQVFMKGYRVIFDRAEDRIGFASNNACG